MILILLKYIKIYIKILLSLMIVKRKYITVKMLEYLVIRLKEKYSIKKFVLLEIHLIKQRMKTIQINETIHLLNSCCHYSISIYISNILTFLHMPAIEWNYTYGFLPPSFHSSRVRKE